MLLLAFPARQPMSLWTKWIAHESIVRMQLSLPSELFRWFLVALSLVLFFRCRDWQRAPYFVPLVVSVDWPCQLEYGAAGELCLRVCGHRWRFQGASLPTHQAIFVANHSSTVDTFLMPSLFPSRTSVAKKEYLVSHHWPIGLVGWFSVDRSPEPNSECGQPATACEAHHPGSHQPLAYARGNPQPGRAVGSVQNRVCSPCGRHQAARGANRTARYLPAVASRDPSVSSW